MRRSQYSRAWVSTTRHVAYGMDMPAGTETEGVVPGATATADDACVLFPAVHAMPLKGAESRKLDREFLRLGEPQRLLTRRARRAPPLRAHGVQRAVGLAPPGDG